MWGILLISVAVGYVAAQSGSEETLVVNIKQGPVRGHRQTNSDVFAFFGIPYATAPTGRQKFMPPLAPPQWTDTFDAVNKYIFCIQPQFDSTQEDCLVANVYVPDTNQTNLPVMVTVHGGSFQFLFGTYQEPVTLVNSTDMIVVTFNYRLGVHGFLCLGTEEIPGNAGMKDQVALLRWVRDNIAYFGGNPNDVTIEGCSAGGFSVELLSLSPMAQGLFHRVISNSGGTIGPLIVQVDPLENARIYANALTTDNVDDIEALEEFYKTASYETLISRVDVIAARLDSSVLFVPCVEADLGTEMFLDDAPINLLKKPSLNTYPMLYGYANMEGLLQVESFDVLRHLMNANFSHFVPADLQFDSDDEKEEVAKKIKQFYFGNEDVNENNILSFIDFYTDVLFAYPMLHTVKIRAEAGHKAIYLYEYSFVDNNTNYVPHTEERGAGHCSQTGAVVDEDTTNATDEYILMKEIMREFFTNFVTQGEPVPQGSLLPAWTPANAQRSPHLSIGPNLQLLGPLSQRRAEFWDGIYEKHYRTPISPRNSALNIMFSPYFVIVMLIVNFINNKNSYKY
ncbi:venom carboxylesterase-6-like [Plodia interpunctella]|uniref:venom carboxylesterase-6-like n=1 Tax=Plodia interpunctella TaxID=58824 RepID=UPI002367A2B3|nr:venom carboxylesterase-6-like [Plodia interpunctella]